VIHWAGLTELLQDAVPAFRERIVRTRATMKSENPIG
jgi:hypothetical protein